MHEDKFKQHFLLRERYETESANICIDDTGKWSGQQELHVCHLRFTALVLNVVLP